MRRIRLQGDEAPILDDGDRTAPRDTKRAVAGNPLNGVLVRSNRDASCSDCQPVTLDPALPSRTLSGRGRLEAGRSEKLLDARSAAESEPDRTPRGIKAQLQKQEWTAATLQQDPVERVLNELSFRIESRGVPVRGLSHFAKPSRDTSGNGRSPSLLLAAQRTEIASQDRLVIAHRPSALEPELVAAERAR
jgi:hypothetical protein